MMKYIRLLSVLLVVLAVLTSCAICGAEEKQKTDPWQTPITIDLKDVSTRKALDALFSGTGINYAVDSIVDGYIQSFSIRDMRLRTALDALIKTAGLTYREDNGVVIITVDPARLGKSVSVDFKDTPIEEALNTLFQKAGESGWSIDKSVSGVKVTYSATDVPFRRALVEILRPSKAKFADKRIWIDSLDKVINIEAKNMPLSDVLHTIFENSGISYTMDQGLDALSVTAVLKNAPLEVALKSVCKTAGLVYRIDNGIYLISAKPQQMFNGAMGCAVTPDALNASSGFNAGARLDMMPGMTAGTATEVIDLKYVNAGDIAPFIKSRSIIPLTVTATSGNRIILRGTEDDIASAEDVIRALDTENALPRPVRLKLAAKITVATEQGPKVYDTSTESVGAEQTPIALNLEASVGYTTSANKPVEKKETLNYAVINLLQAAIVPSMNADGTIGLSGQGRFSFPFDKHPENQLTKSFNLAASVDVGKPYNIAAGSINLDIGKVDFVVTITATPEKGRVYVAPKDDAQQQPGNVHLFWGQSGSNQQSKY
ncbi:hypothetical protein LLG46_06540 [bacterium]|nr:hypothetical protein [bacterium]